VKAATDTFVNFLFAHVNIQQPIFALVANKSIRVNHDFMQIRGRSKSSELQYFWTKTFCYLYISVKGTFLAYSCEQIVEVKH